MTTNIAAAKVNFINKQYIPRLSIRNADQYLEKSAIRSAYIRKKLPCFLDLPYGNTPLQTLDIFPATVKNSPVHIFIHGGYWRAQNINKQTYSHIAGPLVKAGATAVLVDYDLCPQVRITDIVKQIQSAIAWIYGNISKYNGDAKNLYLSGHSAGGHLVGMIIATDWPQEKSLPKDLISGFISLSGLFDIEPHRHSQLQKDIRLSKKEAKAMSPMYLKPICTASSILAVGSEESDLFHWQSLQFAAHLRLHRIKAQYISLPNDNHFSITDRLGNYRDPLTKIVRLQMGL